jgi:lipopolysaccharide/colanic/teichoic acid biosynthesis glycosyltransferase
MPEPLTMVMVGAGSGSLLLGLARRQFRIAKRGLDIVGSLIGLIIFAPVMTICGVMIKFSDPSSPVIYRQTRVGLYGRLITIYKMRTMYADAESHGKAIRADRKDGRVIPICRWMRRSHMDELPQLFNILCGDMSLVGPRPERPELTVELAQYLPDFEQRLSVKPGLTGLAQIKNGYDTDMDSIRRKLEYDLEYIRTMSLGLELRLLAQTLTKFNDDAAR